jgi:hypothetical protein
MLRTDLLDRAVPWARLLRERPVDANALNLRPTQKIAALAAAGVVALLASAAVQSIAALLLPMIWLGGLLLAERWAKLAWPVAGLVVMASGVAIVGLPSVRLELLLASALLAVMIGLNAGLFRLVARQLGLAAATLGVVPMIGHYWMALLGFAIGTATSKPGPRPARPWSAVHLYAGLALLLTAASIGGTLVMREVRPSPELPALLMREDALDYYAHLPTLLLDGDADYTNQIMRRSWQFDADHPLRQINRYTIGTAATAAPAFVVGVSIERPLHRLGVPGFRADGYGLLTQMLVRGWMIGLGCGGLFLLSRMLAVHFAVPERWAVVATLSAGLFSTSGHYLIWQPMMAHTAAAFWVAVGVWAAARADAGWRGGLATCVAALLMASLVRPPAVLFLALPLTLAWRLWRRGVFTSTSPAWALATAAGLLIAGQAWLTLSADPPSTDHLAGRIGYAAEERFFWTDPALLLSLFSTRNGLFTYSPVLLLGLIGVLFRRRGAGPIWLFLPLLLATAALWYVNASWYAWWFGDAFGNRGFIAATPVFALGLGLLLRHPPRHGWLILLALTLTWHLTFNGLYLLEILHTGQGWSIETEHIPHRQRF